MNTTTEKRVGAAGLYHLDPTGAVTRVLEGVTISNGITWSLDEKTMYYIDTLTREIWSYDFTPSEGSIRNKRILVNVPENEGMPDGMTRDEEGNLWVAHWGGGKVNCWDPLTGKKLREVSVPAPHTTSCVFGGPDLDELFITTARSGLSEEMLERYPLSGNLFRVKPGVRGLPPYRFG
jgi:sugar lactone lactonase YvrE